MTDIYVSDSHPYYQVWVEGRIWKTLVNTGDRLTWSEINDIVLGFMSAIDDDWPLW